MASDSGKIITDISVLYELSLSIGRSLELKENCDLFLRTLMSRKDLAYAAVWLKKECLPQPGGKAAEPDALVLCFAHPESRVRETELPHGHPIVQRLTKEGPFSVASGEPKFKPVVTEANIGKGVYAVFPLGKIGLLKLFSMSRQKALGEDELNQIASVIDKFTVSIEGCLAHQKVITEANERKQAEERYRNVVERALDGIGVVQDGNLVFVNGQIARMAGMDREKMIGQPFLRFVHPSQHARVKESYERRMAGETSTPVWETVLVNGKGDSLVAELNAGLITYDGRPADLVFVRDITERRRSELERVRLAMAVEQTADAVVITSPEGDIQYVNPAFERITGYTRAEVLGKNPRLLKSGKQDAATYKALWETIRRGEAWFGRFQNRKKDGSTFVCDAIITPTRAENGSIINFVAVQRDVTRELQMEEQYLQAQKMESMGRLAGGIAHDFNNIMTAVLGFGTMVLDQLGENHPLRHAIEQIVSAGERATNLTRQLLTFSRKQMVEVRTLELNAVVMDMYQLLKRALGEDVELVTLLDDQAGSVRADAGLLQQVIMNLAINARDAMPRGGRLTVNTAHTPLDASFCRSRVDVAPGDYVRLSVTDTGFGMDSNVLSHLFEPFFTTKPKGKGTGLGLATVYGIVRQCGGYIEVHSEKGKGTEIRIWLPRLETAEEAVPVELEEKLQHGNETILVVEDEDLVRDLTVRILKSLGYAVLEASNGREALALVGKYKDKIHLVLSDVVMPQMGGPEMAEKLVEMRPGLKVIFTSGFTESAVIERGVSLGKVRLIQKPYTCDILAQRVRETLDGK